MFALATAYRLRAEQAAVGDEPVGWQRWRRQLIQQNRDKVIIFAQGWYGILGIRLKRDSMVSVMYPEELNSVKSSVTLRRTDRHGILGQKPADFQLSL
jgi:hypothetical protein